MSSPLDLRSRHGAAILAEHGCPPTERRDLETRAAQFVECIMQMEELDPRITQGLRGNKVFCTLVIGRAMHWRCGDLTPEQLHRKEFVFLQLLPCLGETEVHALYYLVIKCYACGLPRVPQVLLERCCPPTSEAPSFSAVRAFRLWLETKQAFPPLPAVVHALNYAWEQCAPENVCAYYQFRQPPRHCIQRALEAVECFTTVAKAILRFSEEPWFIAEWRAWIDERLAQLTTLMQRSVVPRGITASAAQQPGAMQPPFQNPPFPTSLPGLGIEMPAAPQPGAMQPPFQNPPFPTSLPGLGIEIPAAPPPEATPLLLQHLPFPILPPLAPYVPPTAPFPATPLPSSQQAFDPFQLMDPATVASSIGTTSSMGEGTDEQSVAWAMTQMSQQFFQE